MKASQLKKLIKESMKEAIQEEFKDIILEAVRSQTSNPSPQINESKNNMREQYRNMLRGNQKFDSTSISTPLMVNNVDTSSPNGRLPEGEVSLDQISNFIKR